MLHLFHNARERLLLETKQSCANNSIRMGAEEDFTGLNVSGPRKR